MGLRAAATLLVVLVTGAAAAAQAFTAPAASAVCVNEGASRLRVSTCTTNYKRAADKFRVEISRLLGQLNTVRADLATTRGDLATARSDLTTARSDLTSTKAALRSANAAKATCQADFKAERNARYASSECELDKAAAERERDEIQALQLSCVVDLSDCYSKQLGGCRELLAVVQGERDDCLAGRGTCLEKDLPAAQQQDQALLGVCDNDSVVTPGFKQQWEAATQRVGELDKQLDECCAR